MPIDRCCKCGSTFIDVKEQTYGYYEVSVLKCTECDTIFGVVNQNNEIEDIKSSIDKIHNGVANGFKSNDNSINLIGIELKKIWNEIEKLSKR